MSNTPNPSASDDRSGNKRRAPLPKDLIARFRELTIRQHETKSSVKANGIYDQISALRRTIYAAGESESRRLLTLLDDPHPAVRLKAAFDALTLDPDAGVRVLRELAAGPRSWLRLRAETILERYFKGDMNLQPWNTEGEDS